MARDEKQAVVRIDLELYEELEKWLETKDAKKEGFHSRAPFVNVAVRELLEKYKKKRFEHFNFAENVIRLIDNEKPAGTPYIEIALKNLLLICRSCESKNCIHIEEAWNNTEIRRQLKRKNLEKLV